MNHNILININSRLRTSKILQETQRIQQMKKTKTGPDSTSSGNLVTIKKFLIYFQNIIIFVFKNLPRQTRYPIQKPSPAGNTVSKYSRKDLCKMGSQCRLCILLKPNSAHRDIIFYQTRKRNRQVPSALFTQALSYCYLIINKKCSNNEFCGNRLWPSLILYSILWVHLIIYRKR